MLLSSHNKYSVQLKMWTENDVFFNLLTCFCFQNNLLSMIKSKDKLKKYILQYVSPFCEARIAFKNEHIFSITAFLDCLHYLTTF